MWRKPKPIQWPKKPNDLPEWECQVSPSQDMDQWYQEIWEDAERYADHIHAALSLPKLQEHSKGRAATKEVVWTDQQPAPVKPNRKGDIQSELACSNMTHSRWTKQVRRLQHYARAAQSEAMTVTIDEHKANLWRKIRNAPGVQSGFTTWWDQLTKVLPESPQHIPMNPPNAAVANQIFLEFSRH